MTAIPPMADKLSAVDITQADREAAADLIAAYWPNDAQMQQLAGDYRAGHTQGVWAAAFAEHRLRFATPNTPEAPQEGLVEAAFRAGHQLGFDAAESTSRSQSGHVEDAWREYCAALTRLPSSILAGEAERLREALMECELALPVLATMCGAAGLNAGKSRAIEILKDVRAALTPPSSPASADRDYHRGIHDAALALDARGHDALAGIVRSLLHKPDYLSPASAEVGEIVERAYETWRAAPLNLGADPEHHQIIRAAFEGGFRARDRLIRRLVADADEEQARAERLSSPSPALRVAEEALEPFARLAEEAEAQTGVTMTSDGAVCRMLTTMGDLRRARTALATIRAEQGDAR